MTLPSQVLIDVNRNKFWHYVKFKTKTRTGVSDLITSTQDGNGILTTNDKGKVNTLSSFFASFFTNEGNGDIQKLKGQPVMEAMTNLEIKQETTKTPEKNEHK